MKKVNVMNMLLIDRCVVVEVPNWNDFFLIFIKNVMCSNTVRAI